MTNRREVETDLKRCPGPWNVLILDHPYKDARYTITPNGVDCGYAVNGEVTLCNALRSSAVQPTPCIKDPDSPFWQPDFDQDVYEADILEGRIVFDAKKLLVRESPNFNRGQKDVPIQRMQGLRLKLFMTNVGRPLRPDRVAYPQLSDPVGLVELRNARDSVTERVKNLNTILGKKVRDHDPLGRLITSHLVAGYYFRAPREVNSSPTV